jgi:hypothetical protein
MIEKQTDEVMRFNMCIIVPAATEVVLLKKLG